MTMLEPVSVGLNDINTILRQIGSVSDGVTSVQLSVELEFVLSGPSVDCVTNSLNTTFGR